MKKGFTLVELLAVIVILAIISLIGVPIVLNIITSVEQSIEMDRAEFLKDMVESYVGKNYLNDNEITEEQIFVIQDNVEYQLDGKGNRVQTNNFKHRGKLCDYCIVKINPQKEFYILFEGTGQDIKKEYDSKNLVQEKLNQPRNVISLYNELLLFTDIYVSNNSVSSAKTFKSNGENLYEVLSQEEEKEVAKLYNSTGNGRIDMQSYYDYVITITTADDVYKFDGNGLIRESENVNGEYPEHIVYLYDELLYSAENYLKNTVVEDEVYFEFSDRDIYVVDEYGNITRDDNMSLNYGVFGSGELKINSSNQISVVIYDTNSNIKNDYGSKKLYSEPLKHSRDGYELVKNLSRLELLAENYKGNNNITTDWLVFYYIRQLKYNSTTYDIVTGTDDGFVGYVNSNAPDLNKYFLNKNTYIVNNHEIDLNHFGASLSALLHDTLYIYHIAYEELEYDCVASWAGDLHQMMRKNIFKSGVKEQYGSYLNAIYKLMGHPDTMFNIGDVYADLDAWSLYYNIKENSNLSISELFDQYYSGESARSYKNRYTTFISIMNDIAPQFQTNRVNFEGVVNHFVNLDIEWQKMEEFEIEPTDAEKKEIADGFIKWIKEQAAKEK